MGYQKTEDEFIGRTFGDISQLVVTGWFGDLEGQTKRYTVHCNTCAKDPELFGEANYLITKPKLLKGVIPCGCSAAPKLSGEQLQIKVGRECSARGYEHLSTDTSRRGVDAKIQLKCSNDGHIWDVTINSFLRGSGCRQCANESLKVSDECMVESFKASGAFIEGTTFKRVYGQSRRFWNLTCPICSHDKYVKAGLCQGEFISACGSLQDGRHPCRCSPSYKWTQEQREFQIIQLIAQNNLPYKFVGWNVPSDVPDPESRVAVECDHHGVWYPSTNNFINNGGRCPTCTGGGGFKLNLPASFYVIDAGAFTGYGISNTLLRRLGTHRSSLSEQGLCILKHQSFDAPGTVAYKLESAIKSAFVRFSQDIPGFIYEATLPGQFGAVVAFAQEWLASSEHTALPEP